MNIDKPKTEAPIADRLAERTVAAPTASLLDTPLPGPTSDARGPVLGDLQGPTRLPRPTAPGHPVALTPAMPDLSLGGFFAQQKSLIDERRHHLDRMGMLPNHVAALRMPDLDDAPKAPAVFAETLPPVNQADGEAKPTAEPKTAPAMPEGEVQ